MVDSVSSLVFKLLLALSIVVTSSGGYAADSHKSTVLKVKEKVRKKSNIKKKAGDRQGRPRASTAEIFSVEVEKKLVKGINKTIAYLKKTVRSLPKKSAARLEMLTRIHNLHMEQAVYVAAKEERVFAKKWDAWDKGGRKGREPKLNNRASRGHWKKVSDTARVILKEYPKSKNADTINFNQALSLSFLGKEKSAARAFTQLIRRYPNSAVAGDSYFALGDYYFDRNDFTNAKTNFIGALKYKRSKRYGWAVFKLGWCYYNLGQYKQAKKYWMKTVSLSKRKGRKGVRLKDEALRDLVYVFSEEGRVEEAIAYFRANGGAKYIANFLTLLANTLSDQGNFSKAIKVWKRLQSIVGNDPSSAVAQKEIISLNFDLSRLNNVWIELEKYYKKYGRNSSWAKNNERKLVLETQVDIQDSMLYYSKLIHSKAQKRSSNALYSQAVKGYMLYLKYYPKTRQVPEVRFNLADIEFQKKKYRAAGQLYLNIALMGKSKAKTYDKNGKPLKNIHLQASQYMLDSYNRDFEPELKRLLKVKPNFNKPPRPISTRAKNFIKACGYYMKWYPKDKKTVRKCDTFVAEIYYRNNDRKRALSSLWVIASKYPNTKEGRGAVENLIPLYKNDKKGLELTVSRLLKIPAYQKGKIGKKLRALRNAADVERIASEKNISKRAALFEARAKKFPKSPEAPKFLNNAAVDYLKSGSLLKAMGAYALLTKRYPRHATAEDATLQLAKLYDRRYDFPSASSYYLKYANTYPRSKSAPGAIQRACDLQIAVNSSSAIRTCSLLMKKYSGNAKIAFEKLIQNAWRSKKYGKMSTLINQYYLPKFKLSANEKVIANYRIYQSYNGRGGPAGRALRQISSVMKSSASSVSGEALRYLGEIAFKNADRSLAPYLKLTLKGGTVNAMLASIQKKNAAIANLEKVYGQVVSTKDSYWGVAAYHQLGYAYEHFAQLLKNPPTIKGAKIEDVKKELAGSVTQAEAKAKEYYKAGLDISKKFTVYNEWPNKLRAAQGRMKGQKLVFDDWVVSPDFIGTQVSEKVASAALRGK